MCHLLLTVSSSDNDLLAHFIVSFIPSHVSFPPTRYSAQTALFSLAFHVRSVLSQTPEPSLKMLPRGGGAPPHARLERASDSLRWLLWARSARSQEASPSASGTAARRGESLAGPYPHPPHPPHPCTRLRLLARSSLLAPREDPTQLLRRRQPLRRVWYRRRSIDPIAHLSCVLRL